MTAPNVIGDYMDREVDRGVEAAHREACRVAFENDGEPRFLNIRDGGNMPAGSGRMGRKPGQWHPTSKHADKPVLRLSPVVWGIAAALWAYPAALLVGWVLQYFGGMW